MPAVYLVLSSCYLHDALVGTSCNCRPVLPRSSGHIKSRRVQLTSTVHIEPLIAECFITKTQHDFFNLIVHTDIVTQNNYIATLRSKQNTRDSLIEGKG
jgi:hypothetical protein